ncbi:hypothetical protein K501DRAFT_167310 [Backusella circina FSU 941]|nr:hypothetical protein K501DRAFT_167310 [Backusella circina FSU 941]
MNTLELEYYFKCTQSEYLDFVGYRNELSVILTITTILKSRLRNITSISLDKDNHKEWQTFALMYRAGQEDVYRAVLSKMEEVKRNLIQKMAQDLKENKLANRAPFLSIHNPEIVKEKQEDNIELDSSPFLSLDMVLIDIRKLLAKDKAFSDVISELFEDFEQEADMIMMLCLIHERNNPDSEWKSFFDKTTRDYTNNGDGNDQDDINDLYESIIPDFSKAFPDIFKTNVYSVKAIGWADYILNGYAINDPFAIVPL